MEHHYFQQALAFLRAHPHWSNFFIFIVAFSESLPLIGTIVPGSITMTLVGILIGSGALPISTSLLIASIGAFTGDCVGFSVGYYYNERLRVMWPFKKHPQWLSMGEAFFNKHGGKSIIFGRFIGPARSTVPLIAGLLKLSWMRFVVAAIPSAIFWALMYMTPGILLGALSREIPKAETTRFFLYGLAVLLTVWLIYWLIQHFFIQLTRGINYLTDRFWGYLTRKNGGRFFIRLITNQQNPSDHHQLTLSLTAILSAVLFFILLYDVRMHGVLTTLNQPIFHALQTLRTPQWNKIFSGITIMGMPKTILLISLFMIAGLAFKKQWRFAAHFIVAVILTTGSVVFFKAISHSLRPIGFEQVSLSSSFPSGHTTFSFVIFSFIAFGVMQVIEKQHRWIPWILSILLIIAVALSRIYLGAHWFADIVGSFLLGLTILFICIVSYRRMPSASGQLTLPQSILLLITAVSLLLPWSINVTYLLTPTIEQTTPIWSMQYVTISTWWESPLHIAPLYRHNRLGKPFQPFNVQWQGDLEKIKKTLKNAGWKSVSNHAKLKSTLQRFSSHQGEYHLPLFAWLYQNKPPVLFVIKKIPMHKRIIELRLWESHVHFKPGNKPLWIGAIDIRIPPKILLSLKERTIISLSDNGGLNELFEDTQHFERKTIQVTVDPALTDIQKLNWNGKILLLRERNGNKLSKKSE